ncbi:MAG TPA: sugar phosphate isomerase/epimerase family protein [Candidatus Deferrimicrobium sp.]|nr:sugar phosphate isomerase/epimerase family protein [Candidatus Deferrimicrobium sp.]
MELIKEAGFDAVSLWWEDEEEGDKYYILDSARKMKLEVENIHLPIEGCDDFWHKDSAKRVAAVSKYLAWIHDCKMHNIPIMVMHVSNNNTSLEPCIEGINALSVLAEEAEKCGVMLAVENTQGQERFIPYVFSQIKSPNLGFCYDSSHDWLLSTQKTKLLNRFGNRLTVLHISDNDGKEDRHWLPWEGIIDWNLVASNIPACFNWYLTLEVFPKLKEEPFAFLVAANERAAKLRNLIDIQGTSI